MTEAALVKAVQTCVERNGYEFVGAEFIPAAESQCIRVYADTQNGITVDQLQKLSRDLDAELLVEYPDMSAYTLEVSSPGIDRPLFTAEQYSKYIGQEIKVKLSQPVEGQKRYTGVILAVEDDQITLETEFGETGFSLSVVAKARLIPKIDFNRNKRREAEERK